MIRSIIRINSIVIVLLALLFAIYPPIRAALDLMDPALREPGTPKAAWRLFKNLTPRYEIWARKRLSEGPPQSLSTNNISGTEWPLFGSVFYLWAVENLEDAWLAGDHSLGVEPRVFAKDAIVAASELVVDPKHAWWVKEHWGDDYLHRENVFYRMLVMGALTVRQKLCQDDAHLDLLRDQVETFCSELEASKTGLMDDYPGECYPGDVMAALMCVKRADAVLGTNHTKVIERALRGFVGNRATRYQLPPYMANSSTGLPVSESRGCANSYICLTASEVWPLEGRRWYALYDRFFWQERLGAAGYREFPKGTPRSGWKMDVDSGPVLAGYGVVASAFGVGASRKNGRFDRAFPLASELLATAWELPNGALAVPRLLSNLRDAPMLGEAAILWQLSIQPQKGFTIKTGGSVPLCVYILLITLFLIGVWRILESMVVFRDARRADEIIVWVPGFQAFVWICLMVASLAAFPLGHTLIGLATVMAAVLLPIQKRKRPPRGTEDWPGESSPAVPPNEPKVP
jgi:hypothetical protein